MSLGDALTVETDIPDVGAGSVTYFAQYIVKTRAVGDDDLLGPAVLTLDLDPQSLGVVAAEKIEKHSVADPDTIGLAERILPGDLFGAFPSRDDETVGSNLGKDVTHHIPNGTAASDQLEIVGTGHFPINLDVKLQRRNQNHIPVAKLKEIDIAADEKLIEIDSLDDPVVPQDLNVSETPLPRKNPAGLVEKLKHGVGGHTAVESHTLHCPRNKNRDGLILFDIGIDVDVILEDFTNRLFDFGFDIPVGDSE